MAVVAVAVYGGVLLVYTATALGTMGDLRNTCDTGWCSAPSQKSPLGEPGEANSGHVFISSVHETPSYSEFFNVFQIPAFNILGKDTLYLFPRQPMLDSQHFLAHSVVILAHTALCEPHTWGCPRDNLCLLIREMHYAECLS